MEIITIVEAKEKGLKRYFTGKPCKNGHISERNIRSQCIQCEKERGIKYRTENKEEISKRMREYRNNNKEKIKEYNKEYKNSHKEDIAKYYKKNKEIIKNKAKKYYLKNKEYIIERNKQYKFKNILKRREYEKKYREENIKHILNHRRKNKKRISLINKIYRKTEKGRLSHNNSNYKRRTKERQGDATTVELLELKEKSTHCYWCNVSLKNKTTHIDHYFPLSMGGKHTLSNLVVTCATCNLKKRAKLPSQFANEMGRLL